MEHVRKLRLREIPAVNEIILHPLLRQVGYPGDSVTAAVQEVLTKLRSRILTTEDNVLLKTEVSLDDLAKETLKVLEEKFAPCLQRVVNATGVVLHTNCGRSVLPGKVLEFVTTIAGGYSNLELNLDTGERGSRYWHVEELICRLTGAEAAMVVNNNAAAVLLVMRALAYNREVIVSRGELVEVGGAFRIPEVLKAGGAELVEVGTTNKTRIDDFSAAVSEQTALLLKVHTSNFRIYGFTESVASKELVQLGRKHGIPVVEDLGSGTLLDLSAWGLPYEPTVQESLKSGVDVVTFSGDKLLGGPQAGIIAGSRKYIDCLKKDQLTRALRIDKLTLAALEGTLRLYLREEWQEIPSVAMLTVPLEELLLKAEGLAEQLKAKMGALMHISVEEGSSQAGGGSLPTAELPTILVSLKPLGGTVNELEEFLRRGANPVLARIQKEQLLLDVRTLLPGDTEIILEKIISFLEY